MEPVMRIEVKKTIRRTSIATSIIAVVLSPIPLADELLFLPIYAFMTSRIAKAHGLARGMIPWKPVLSTAIAALTARATVNITVSYIPGVAAVANAASAVVLTELFGRYVDASCADPAAARAMTVKQILLVLREKITAKVAT